MSKIENMYPLSPTQQGLLFHTLLTPAAGIYVPQIVLELSGQIDSAILRRAWQVVIDRNAVLRTGFQWQQRDEPFQVVYREAELVWTEQNWTDAPVDEHQRMLDALLAANRTQPFDLHRPPLMRLNLIKRSGEHFTLVWCYHHLILDGWSAGLVMQQVMQAYGILKSSGPSSLTLLKSPPPYVDYIAWLQRQDQPAAKEFWTSRLSGKSSSSLAALHATTSSDQQAGFDEVTLSLNSSETSEIRGFLQDHGLTLNHLLQAAFGLLLSRYNHTREVTLGTTVSGRSSGLPDAMSMIGLFINTLPIRLSPNPGSTSVDWMHQIRDEQSAASDFEHVSLRDIQNWAGDGGPMFDCLFVLESYPLQVDQQQNSALNLDGIRFDEWTHLPLTLLVHEGDSLSVRAKYQRARLDGAAVKRMIDQAKRLLTNFVRKPTQPLGCFSLISETDRTTVSHWNETNQCWPESDQTLVDLLDRHRDSDHVAVVFDEASLTFSQLHQRADRIAIQLLKASVGADQPVAVLMRRCLDLPVALLAIVKAGAAFMPLDPEMPESRLQSILQDVQPSAIITNNTHLSFGIDELLASCGQTKIVDVAQAFPYQVQETDNMANATIFPASAAYVIHTSGSTGNPKGVINTHEGIVNRLLWMQDRYHLKSDDSVAQKTPVSFDVSVWEFFWPLISGSTMEIALPDQHRDAQSLVQWVISRAITTMHFVPPMLDAFLEVANVADCTSLRRVICSGETLSAKTTNRFFERLPECELHNLYGPAEAAIDVTSWQCKKGEMSNVPIGHPISNTQIHLLDDDYNQVPIGVEGDLYIAGMGLARGYFGQPRLTAEAFIPNPFSKDHSTLYRTGDRARSRDDGAIEFLGRSDFQIKIRGQRIELGEIESVLLSHTAIHQAVAVAREIADSMQIVAYVVLHDDAIRHASNEATELEATVRKMLGPRVEKHLSAAMQPSRYVVVESIPLSVNGKIDREALPIPSGIARNKSAPPETETEIFIAEIWKQVLQVETIGKEDHFFELGGHSLSATRVNTRLSQKMGAEMPLRKIFEQPVLSDLARHVDAQQIAMATSTNEGDVQIEI